MQLHNVIFQKFSALLNFYMGSLCEKNFYYYIVLVPGVNSKHSIDI